MTMLLTDTRNQVEWVDVCEADALMPDRGAAALVEGQQVAIFVLRDGRAFALDNRDPWSGANVMSRGIVGSIGDRVVVASPMYKHHVDLDTGAGVEHADVRLRTWPVRVRDGRIEVGAAPHA